MRFLILSDIHANWEALEAVLNHARGQYDQAVCCGDIVGYGADPDAVTGWVRQNIKLVVRGNHDKACAGLEDLEWFNPVARVSALWTQQTTDPANVTYLRELPQGPMAVDGFQILHGSPVDEDEYVISALDAEHIFPYVDTNVTFFGHTHLQGGFQLAKKNVRKLYQAMAEREDLDLNPDDFYLINPGSVGQPRDGDPRAAYATYDSERRVVALCRVNYDVSKTRGKILQAGLPEVLAARLELGY